MTPTLTVRDMRFSTATTHDTAAGLADLLTTLIGFLRHYVVITDTQALAIVLWAAHTHVIDAFDCTPYVQVTSVTKRSGKTRLLEVLETVVARPWLTGRTSAAALVRKVHKHCPTLLLDESDAAFGGDKEYAEALRGLLNTGYRRSGKATLCIGQGAKIDFQDFSTFCPKTIAGIGRLPDTVADRAILIALRRRTTDEPCEKWRERDGWQQGAPIRDRLIAWGAQAVEVLRDARPEMPDLNDRAMDVWEPLIAIADLAGDDWPALARRAAIVLTGSVEDADITVELLQDVSEILDGWRGTSIPSKVLIEKLTEQDERPWATWRKGEKPITQRGLARLLGPLGIHPDRHDRIVRGYRMDAFSDAIARYLPLQVSQRHNANKTGPESPISKCHDAESGDGCKTAETSIDTGAVTHGHIEAGVPGDGRF